MKKNGDVVERLKSSGLTRYRIYKEIGCSWNTVDMWFRGVWKPSDKYKAKIESVLERFKR